MHQLKIIKNIILEEVEVAKANHLIEQTVTSNWPKVEKLFAKINKYPGYFSGMKTFVFDDPETGIVHFYSDGTAYIQASDTNTTWEYSQVNGTPVLKVDGNEIDVIKTTTKRKEKFATKQQKASKLKPIENPSTIDTIQTAMDWLGLIPGYGDIIDAVNAIIYFARGKYLEGTLSLVAIIPVVGSGIKLGFKGALQSLGGLRSASKLWKDAAEGSTDAITAITKFYQEAVSTGKLSKSHLKLIADKGEAVSNILLKGKKYFGPNIDRQIDGVIRTINNTITRPVRESFGSKVISKIKSTIKASKAAEKGKNAFKRLLNVGSLGTIGVAKNIIRKYGVGERELKLLKDAMDVRWTKQLFKSPDKTALIFKSNKRYSAAEAASMGIPPWLQAKPFSQIRDWMDNVKQTDSLKWKSISDYIARTSTDNKLYKTYVDNTFSQASNMFRPGAVFTAGAPDMFSKIIKMDSYRLSNPKNVDIVYNELEDFAEKIGWDTEDNPQGVIMPALYIVYNNYLKSYIEEPASTVAGVATGVATGFGLGGDTTNTDQPGETTSISTAGSTIKTDFKNASGKTTDRLQILKDKGYSEEQILIMKRELGIE